MTPPAPKKIDDTRTHDLGEKIWARRPAKMVVLDIAICKMSISVKCWR
jgi:hypothetical protein